MIKIPVFLLLILLAVSDTCSSAHLHKEKEYQDAWCTAAGGIQEVVLDDGARVDCVTEEYAVEFDFAPKWAEAIGQALYYANKTGLKPGVVLILEGDDQQRFADRLGAVASDHAIRVWSMTEEHVEPVKFTTRVSPDSAAF